MSDTIINEEFYAMYLRFGNFMKHDVYLRGMLGNLNSELMLALTGIDYNKLTANQKSISTLAYAGRTNQTQSGISARIEIDLTPGAYFTENFKSNITPETVMRSEHKGGMTYGDINQAMKGFNVGFTDTDLQAVRGQSALKQFDYIKNTYEREWQRLGFNMIHSVLHGTGTSFTHEGKPCNDFEGLITKVITLDPYANVPSSPIVDKYWKGRIVNSSLASNTTLFGYSDPNDLDTVADLLTIDTNESQTRFIKYLTAVANAHISVNSNAKNSKYVIVMNQTTYNTLFIPSLERERNAAMTRQINDLNKEQNFFWEKDKFTIDGIPVLKESSYQYVNENLQSIVSFIPEKSILLLDLNSLKLQYDAEAGKRLVDKEPFRDPTVMAVYYQRYGSYYYFYCLNRMNNLIINLPDAVGVEIAGRNPLNNITLPES
jgi:hypothetical protein